MFVVVRISRNIFTYRVRGPAFPFNLGARIHTWFLDYQDYELGKPPVGRQCPAYFFFFSALFCEKFTQVPCCRAVASARRSGQEDFQRGTPPVSLASCSVSPFFRACIITEWSTTDRETDSTGTSILTPLLSYCSASTCHYTETLRLGTIFWLQHLQSLFWRKTNELGNQTKTKTKSHAITRKFHTPTLVYLSTPESTALSRTFSTPMRA